MPPRQPAPAVVPALTTRPTTLKNTLQLVVSAITTRANEAQLLYNNIADLLDAYY
jgi:hypothetical protein